MAKLPVNLKNIITADNLPDGRYRVRVTKPTVYPKDKAMNDRGEIEGETNDKGGPKYGRLRLGFRFVEHPTNYVPGPDGQIQSLVGETKWENINLGMRRTLIEMYNAAGLDLDADLDALDGIEFDVMLKNKPRYDNPEVTEPVAVGFRPAVG